MGRRPTLPGSHSSGPSSGRPWMCTVTKFSGGISAHNHAGVLSPLPVTDGSLRAMPWLAPAALTQGPRPASVSDRLRLCVKESNTRPALHLRRSAAIRGEATPCHSVAVSLLSQRQQTVIARLGARDASSEPPRERRPPRGDAWPAACGPPASSVAASWPTLLLQLVCVVKKPSTPAQHLTALMVRANSVRGWGPAEQAIVPIGPPQHDPGDRAPVRV